LVGYGTLARRFTDRRLMLGLIATGMALDVLITFASLHLFGQPLGPEDGMPLRLLRLARVACFALPILCFLGEDLWKDDVSRLARWGAGSLILGAVSMPMALTLAALVHPALKYLLPVPAIAAFVGVILAAGRSFKHAQRLEQWGWILVGLSMAVGLMMGGYAFNGPLTAPPGLGSYADPARRLMRLAHTDAILLGITAIFVSRHLFRLRNRSPWPPLVTLLAAAGTLLTVGALVARMFYSFPIALLAAGPLIVAAGLFLESALVREYPH
ncbi:MAG TPA: hypothetical protein VFJ58_11475, partial [Armatimonadota bacterium]|nr:hypothetical protein [Armatimonadota bacterium]